MINVTNSFLSHSLGFSNSTSKLCNPNGRFWLKIDGTDVKKGLMESQKRVWNGDLDLGDGSLQNLRQEYDNKVERIKQLQIPTIPQQQLKGKPSEILSWFNIDLCAPNKGQLITIFSIFYSTILTTNLTPVLILLHTHKPNKILRHRKLPICIRQRW